MDKQEEKEGRNRLRYRITIKQRDFSFFRDKVYVHVQRRRKRAKEVARNGRRTILGRPNDFYDRRRSRGRIREGAPS